MAKFCVGCGSPLKAEAKFCETCGAPVKENAGPVGQGTSISQVPAVGSSVSSTPKAGGPLLKIILVVAGLIAFLILLSMGSCAYIAYRAKKKADAIQKAYKTGDFGKVAKEVDSKEQPAAKPEAPYGWTEENGKLVPAPSPFVPIAAPASPTPIAATAAVGDAARDWALKYERTENGPEADLVVRTGDINNLGFGWPTGFDPFSGNSTPPHAYPWNTPKDEPEGTDRIMIGSALDPPADYPAHFLQLNDGYSGILAKCQGLKPPPGQVCKQRAETMPQAIRLAVAALPPKINSVVFQIFVDDFQPQPFHSHFQVSLNGTRLPNFEQVINSLDQTGPIGKLLTLKLLPEYLPLLNSGEVKLLIDDPTTKQGDGYAIDFVRILVNPHNFKYQVSLTASVVDADEHTPISGATVTAGLQSSVTDQHGKSQLSGLPAGLVVATAAAPGYDENSVPVDLVAGQSGNAEIALHPHEESTAALERSIEQTGSVAIYGIHFDTDSAKLRADSMPALNAVLELINKRPGSRWVIAGHTDNQGNDEHNQTLSENRANSVITWLKQHGVDSGRLAPQGFGATRPVADNATASGRALNRRVEVAIAK